MEKEEMLMNLIIHLFSHLRTLWRLTVTTIFRRSNTDYALMDSGFNAIVLLNVQLWKGVSFECRSVANISQSRGVNNISG